MKSGGIPEGAISGKFSISANKQVYFSKGNLQYQGSSKTWRFAENQYDYVGDDSWGNVYVGTTKSSNVYIMDTTYSGWVDLFGWGTGDNPNRYDGYSDYSTFTDWGSNAISNGGNEAGLWRTLTGGPDGEWEYLFNIRSASTVNGTENARYAKAKVNNVQGVILFPDTYTHPNGITAPTGVNAIGNTGWNGNNYSSADWTKMESAGCVFLPTTGTRNDDRIGAVMYEGYYWSSTFDASGGFLSGPSMMHFDSGYLDTYGTGMPHWGCSVRLVYSPKAKGHQYVDLGLPSGTKWATMNVGASQPSDYGLYFQWGDTQGYTADQVGRGSGQKYFGWTDYKYNSGGTSPSSTDMTKYNTTDSKTVLDLEDDAVAANWGGSWHLPTEAQFQELLNTTYVTNTWVTNYNGSGINGRLFTSVSNGNTLFIPAAGNARNGHMDYVGDEGYVWSSSLYIRSVDCGRSFEFAKNDINMDYFYRRSGCSVRGVIG